MATVRLTAAQLMLMALAGLSVLGVSTLTAPAQPGGADGAPKGAEAEGGAAKADAAGPDKPDFPPFKDISKDYVKVVSTADGAESLYTVWRRDKDNQLLAELPRGWANQKHFFATTLARGDTWAGLQGDDLMAYWRRYDKTLALVQPNLDVRSSGDPESKAGVEQTFTDRVLLDVPIVALGPAGQPVFDLDALLAGQVSRFFPYEAAGANAKLSTVKEVKAFPQNLEVSIEMPVAGGRLRTFHYSISLIPENTGYKPREADERVGFFQTAYRDLAQVRDDKKWVRNINRWNLEKRDPSLKLSPPKQPIVYYIENTVPVRYRRWVRQGILEWNKAFEQVGIVDAIEVYYQDKATGAHMDKDPEDVRYNFVRWLTNDISTAIGPSRADPRSGQILDADVVLTDGWIRVFWYQANLLLPEMAMQALDSETISWMERNPKWDPRVRLADPLERERLLVERAARMSGRGLVRYGGMAAGGMGGVGAGGGGIENGDMPVRGIGLSGKTDMGTLCAAAIGKGLDMARMRMHLEMIDLLEPDTDGGAGGGQPTNGSDTEPDKSEADKDAKKEDKKDEKKKEDKPKVEMIDGIPESFVGPMLADLTAHEIGHTLGLRHNFKASSLYALSDINSDKIKGQKPWSGSVMDYNPVNINMGAGPLQGEYNPAGIGPYDMWAIEYGYTSEDPKKVLSRVANRELVYLTDEDVGGPDPLARPYDLAANPLDYAKNQMRLVEYYRGRLTDKFVKDGESWAKARRGYQITLNEQMNAISIAAPWVGGAHVTRARKGDPNAAAPITPVPVEQQRAALQFVIDTAFKDEAFGLTPDLLKYLTVDKWPDGGGMRDYFSDATFPVHDRVVGIQASALSMLLNPTRLRRVYDNELLIPAGTDALTLPEVMGKVADAIWTEINADPSKKFSNRESMISSLRRNLQREHLERLIDLTKPGQVSGAAAKPITNLATGRLREIRAKLKNLLEGSDKARLDDYSAAHLSEAALRIDQVLNASYIYNTDDIGGGGGFPFMFLFGQEPGSGGGNGAVPGNTGGPRLNPIDTLEDLKRSQMR